MKLLFATILLSLVLFTNVQALDCEYFQQDPNGGHQTGNTGCWVECPPTQVQAWCPNGVYSGYFDTYVCTSPQNCPNGGEDCEMDFKPETLYYTECKCSEEVLQCSVELQPAGSVNWGKCWCEVCP